MLFTPESWTIEKVIALGSQYWYSCILHASVQLGIFTALHNKESSVEEIAGNLQSDKRSTEMLLHALVAIGLLTHQQGKYTNTEISQKHLSKESPEYCGYILQHHANMMNAWSKLAQSVRTGQPVRSHDISRSEEEQENFLMGMFNMGMATAPKIAQQVQLRESCHLLDLGGGPGTYSVQFCLNNPQLHATVFDLPGTQPFAEKTIKRFGLSERIKFVAGNYHHDPIPSGYDVVLLSHILHAEGEEQCEFLLKKAIEKLPPSGKILVHDFFLDDDKTHPVFPAMFSLNMLVNTNHGRSYSRKEVSAILEKLGIQNIQIAPIILPNQSQVLMGEKK